MVVFNTGVLRSLIHIKPSHITCDDGSPYGDLDNGHLD